MKTLSLSIATALTLVIGGASLPSHAAPVGSEGSSCTVTSGANQGKSGTVTTENDDQGNTHTWCEGSWGATECSGSNKCAAASVVSGLGGGHNIGKPIFALPATLNVTRAATLAR
jgi:hypothetical protein